jgi:hypothetical protein
MHSERNPVGCPDQEQASDRIRIGYVQIAERMLVTTFAWLVGDGSS